MKKRRFWVLHLFSCLRFDDLEILYSKLRKWGLELQGSNFWGDCFEIKKGVETEYKIVPTNIPVDSITIEHWKLKAKNDKYYVFEYDEQCAQTEIYWDNANKNNFYISEVFFFPTFSICIYPIIQKFNRGGQSVLPDWMSHLFVIAICAIYLGHFAALLISFFQTRHYSDSKKRIKRSTGGFWGRIAISCIVNILQIVLVLIVFWGLMKG
ncbi:MAG: hypothetical protein SPL15_00795 [Lachnospiraceae bacterium]|nr:hypothetical protein [Lachnospiraceae bacterium]MDY5741526.1 hypothetical protein [Lachnospiraceae bacterium]